MIHVQYDNIVCSFEQLSDIELFAYGLGQLLIDLDSINIYIQD